MHILEKNMDKINWINFSKNPSIFTYDYQKIKDHMKNSGIAEGIAMKIFHPDNIYKWADWGFDEYKELEDELYTE
jgi:hypothetical protein